ncbi:hypothetical protein BESB_031070 [Besnoitia besnoiti]|uniref:Uncharacterized protein n=1 Tax=Besnoitia besnoiti TaxID=94643 RepID=A0A2A9M6G1_BESBE|nr:hypothetical protein BESB_031070 [Besnoitia besnoiti]PFH31233.1 hypothetical protein BESB_031070 [Besnoitia besnoiti]
MTELYAFLNKRAVAGLPSEVSRKGAEAVAPLPCYTQITASQMLKQSTVHTFADEEKNLKQTESLLKAYEAKRRLEIRARVEEKNARFYLPKPAKLSGDHAEAATSKRAKRVAEGVRKTSWLARLPPASEALAAAASRQPSRRVSEGRRRSSGSSCCGSTSGFPCSRRALAAALQRRSFAGRRPTESDAGSSQEVGDVPSARSGNLSQTSGPFQLSSREAQSVLSRRETRSTCQRNEGDENEIRTERYVGALLAAPDEALTQRLIELLYLRLYDRNLKIEEEIQSLLSKIYSEGDCQELDTIPW